MKDLIYKKGIKNLNKEDKIILEKQVVKALRLVEDPEIMINVYDMGLIYDIKIDEANNIDILMTLTAPNCPVAQDMPVWIAEAVSEIEKTGEVQIFLTFDPPWNETKMTQEAREMIELF